MPLLKPQFGSGNGGGIVDNHGTHLSIKDPQGNIIYENGHPVKGTEGSKWPVPLDKIPPGSTFSIDGEPAYTIKDPTQRQQYNPTGGGDPTSVGGKGSSGGGSSGIPGGFAPGNIGAGSFPAYLGGLFPSPSLVNYQPIKPADYNFTDPQAFAQKFGEFNRGEVSKNFGQSQDMALQALNTELKGLESFVPAAAALKRSQVSVENVFNQQQRTNQVNQALPGVAGQLSAQASRAETYASGNIPDSVTNASYELGIRSQAADRATFGGLGASSAASQKVSDLLSAEDRVKLSQYGDQLLSTNINQKQSLLLAPTEYSNAGQQINVMPSVSASQLTQQNTGMLNAATLVSPESALSSTVNQNQFTTNLSQRTNEFNATNDLSSQEFNANNINQFALDKFGYQVGFAGTVAGAAQTNTNTQIALQEQQMYQQVFQQYQNLAQQGQQLQSIFTGLGGVFQGLGGISGITSSLSSIFGGGLGGVGGAAGGITGLGDVASAAAGVTGLGDVAGAGGGVGSLVSELLPAAAVS